LTDGKELCQAETEDTAFYPTEYTITLQVVTISSPVVMAMNRGGIHYIWEVLTRVEYKEPKI